MKIFLSVGEDANGKLHLLYLGDNADHAIELMENPPAELGIVKTAFWKKPNFDKRRKFALAAVVAAAVATVAEPVTTAEPVDPLANDQGPSTNDQGSGQAPETPVIDQDSSDFAVAEPSATEAAPVVEVPAVVPEPVPAVVPEPAVEVPAPKKRKK